MAAYRHTSWPLLAGAFLLTGLATIAGITALWQQSLVSSTTYLTRVISELDKGQSVLARSWTRDLEAALGTLADNSRFSVFIDKVSGMNLPADVLRTLCGSVNERQSMLALLTVRRTPEEMDKLRSFASESESIRKDLAEMATRYSFLSITLFSREGAPCLGTEFITERTENSGRHLALSMAGSASRTLSQPAYMNAGRLCVDIAVPMVLTDKRSILTYNVGILLVTIDLGACMERMQAALNPESGLQSLVFEAQTDRSLVMLTAGSANKVPLEGWTTTEDGIPFALRRIPGQSQDTYCLGKRLLTTSLFLVTGLPQPAASALQETDENISLLQAAGLACALLLALFVFFFLVFRHKEQGFLKTVKRSTTDRLQQQQFLDILDREEGLGLVCVDFDNNILFANTTFARLAGKKSPALLMDTTLAELPASLAGDLAQHAGKVWASPTLSTSTMKIALRDREHSYLVHAAPYVDEEGYLAGLLVIYRDISERVAARERADTLIEQTAGTLHRVLFSLDPYAGRLSTLIGEVAVLTAELDGDKSPETARLLSTAGKLCLLTNIPRVAGSAAPKEEGGRHIPATLGLSLGNLDIAGLPVQSTIAGMYERLDGSGLPLGLKAEDISKPSRYLAIAQFFCAALHPRNGTAPEDWKEAFAPLLDTAKFDGAADKLFRYLGTPQGERLILRLRRR